MATLLYCVVELQAPRVEMPAGVGGAGVQATEFDGLRALHSEAESAALSATIRERAGEFHRVVAAIFAEVATISFRFPTLFASGQEMTEHLQPKAAAMAAFLRQRRDQVEMEIRIAPPSVHESQSGAEYLRRRAEQARELERAGEAIRARAAVLDWKQYALAGGLRCYALLRRSDVRSWRTAVAEANLPAGVRAVVSGPWPANEFLDLDK